MGQVVALWVRSNLSDTSARGMIEGRWPAPSETKCSDSAQTEAAGSETAVSTPPKLTRASSKPSDCEEEIDYAFVLNAPNVLPPDIRVLGWAPVEPGFSARFSCLGRTYKYLFFADGLDLAAMHDATQRLVGHHDFRNFCKPDLVCAPASCTLPARALISPQAGVAHFTRSISHASVRLFGAPLLARTASNGDAVVRRPRS